MLRGLARRSLAIAAGVMAAFSALSIFHLDRLIPFAALAGAATMIASGCLTSRRAYRAIDWPILLFMIGAIGLGEALQNTGAAETIARGLVNGVEGFGPFAALAGLTLLTAVMSSLVSNQAVAVLLTPIAINAATTISFQQGLGEVETGSMVRAFILGIALSASICFATPIGHQSNLMVYGPGGYRWKDFLRAGLPLSVIAWVFVTAGAAWMTGAL
jgi:di/tricarboxylate transporter